MYCSSSIFVAFLGLSAAFIIEQSSEERLRRRRSAHYHGPPAPLNKDGTVALTPEVQQARAAHEAAIAAEFIRLEEAKRLAAAHPDLTSLPEHGWDVQKEYTPQHHNQGINFGKGNRADGISGYYSQSPSYEKGHYIGLSTSGQYHQGLSHNQKTHMPAPLNKDGTVALTPEVLQAKAAHEAAFGAELKRLMEAQSLAMAHPDITFPHEYSIDHRIHGSQANQGHSYSPVHSKKPEFQMPAPLNPDGTVAQTPAYKAIASSLNAEYDKVLHSIKHQRADPHFQNEAAHSHAY